MIALGEDSLVALPRWVRLRFDPVRGRPVLLAPERVLFPCPTTVEILNRLGRGRRLGELVDELSGEYDAPRGEILEDVKAVLEDLARQCLLEIREEADAA